MRLEEQGRNIHNVGLSVVCTVCESRGVHCGASSVFAARSLVALHRRRIGRTLFPIHDSTPTHLGVATTASYSPSAVDRSGPRTARVRDEGGIFLETLGGRFSMAVSFPAHFFDHPRCSLMFRGLSIAGPNVSCD